MANLALLDLVLPYVFRGENLGATHAALSALRVVELETSVDDLGSTMRGRCEVNGSLELLPSSGALVAGGVDEASPPHDPSRSEPVFDLRDTTVDFELFVPRAASDIVTAGELAAGSGAAAATAVLDDLRATTPGDYPSTAFTFDLILNAPKFRPPFLHPAKVGPLGVLEPDPSVDQVALVLPRLRFRVSHGNRVGDQLVLSFVSAGVSDLDDPGSVEVSQMISMEPPYAYLGAEGDHVVGIGFRSATLDLDGDWTPPALRDKAGVGDDWTGLYLPEVRLFVSPDGLQGLAFECGAQELLIGLAPTGGLWGDFDAALVQQGGGDLVLRPRFEADGHGYPVVRGGELAGVVQATARVPQTSTMVVDVTGGRTPYTRTVKVNGAAQPSTTTYDIDLGPSGTATIDLEVTSGSSTAAGAKMHLVLSRLVERETLPTPGATPATGPAAEITSETGFDFDLDELAGDQVRVRSVPPEDALVWAADANGASPAASSVGPASAYSTTVAPGTTRTFTVQVPGTSGATTLDYYFHYDKPSGSGAAAVSTTRATSDTATTWTAGSRDPRTAYRDHFQNLPNGTAITVVGNASKESANSSLAYNTKLAWRRAMAVRDLIASQFPGKNFVFTVQPALADPADPTPTEQGAWSTLVGWTGHGDPGRNQYWRATVQLNASTPATNGTVAVRRPSVPAPRTPPPPRDPPPPEDSPPPDWFRRVAVKVRIVDSQLIALQLDLEIDINTMTEEKLAGAGPLPAGADMPRGRTLERGTPVGPTNPADGITAMRVLVQTDPATGRWSTLLTIGADPADTDGLFHFGWIPQVDTMPASKDVGLTFLGSYLSFWPLLAQVPPVDAVRNAAEGRDGAVVDATLSAAALVVPGVVAALPWFAIERVILFGGELLHTQRQGGFTTNLLVDVEMDWSIDLLGLVKIPRERPLKVRYKAIGLSLTNRDTDPPPPVEERWDFRPIFDASRGYTIDVASGGGMQIADPLGQIIRVLGARLSRSNPMTLEVDIGLGVDLGVVAIDQASVRAYLDGSAPPELTALAARIDIPGAIAGSGYVRIGNYTDSAGNTVGTIGGQLDLTIRPVSLRVCAAVEVATITEAATGRVATGVYVGLNVVLPAGIPLGSTGLGIFGFRGIFGMHYQRNTEIGAGTGVPALAWLQAAGGQPHLLRGPDLGGPGTGQVLWKPALDNWAFGIGILIGTMEGGVLINLDGTFLLELPGPRVLIMMNARIISPPPSVGELGMRAGILAVIEITPEHFLIGILVTWEIPDLVKIVIPVEAVFPFGANSKDWHIYLGARSDYGPSVEVDVLGIVRGSGYLMFRGNGLNSFDNGHATLPAITGFGIGLGVAAGFTWGDVDSGLYLRLGGGMDAVLGFEPFTLAGNIWVAGELRLWIVSIGADASLTVVVSEQPPTTPGGSGELSLWVHGQACGHVSFLFFSVSGCVTIEISGPKRRSAIPALVDKVGLQSRSPALAQGSAVDRGVDTTLAEAVASETMPALTDLPAVPVDAIPIVTMQVPPAPEGSVTIGGLGTALTAAPGVGPDGYAARGADRYRYRVVALRLERVKGNGQVEPSTLIGTSAPVVWWSIAPAPEANPGAQLALLTWKASPATKAIEYTDKLVEDIISRWGTACTPAAPPAEVLWTFLREAGGPSDVGWELDGAPWPDPPGTQRSTPVPTELAVDEPWRSGDPQLDALRGVVPAWVLGSLVSCTKRQGGDERPPVTGIRDVARPRTADAAPELLGHPGFVRPELLRAAARDVLRPAPSALAVDAEALRLLVARPGTAASAVLAGITGASDPATTGPLTRGPLGVDSATTGGKCPVKVLRSPMLDRGQLTIFPDKELQRRLEEAGLSAEKRDLWDVVRIRTGAVKTVAILLGVDRRDLERGRVVVRSVAADGSELDRVVVTPALMVGASIPLPPHWVDPAGPWDRAVDDLVQWTVESGNPAVFVELPGRDDVDHVDVGVLPEGRVAMTAAARKEGVHASYHLAAVALTSAAEVARADWDQTQVQADRTTVTQATAPASTDYALLHPNSRYRIVVDWFADREGDTTPLGSATSPQRQTFWFRTDTIATSPADPTDLVFTDTPDAVPVRLDPWTMMTIPDDEETGWFGREKLRVVFNTHDVDRLFTAHGKELRLRLEAANGQHPESGGPVPHPLPITSSTLTLHEAALLSPWEEAYREALERMEGTCLVEGERKTHAELTVPIPLHPFMGYLLDVECVPTGSPASTRGPRVFRRHFTTGGFGTIGGLASSVATERPTARFSQVGAFSSMPAAIGSTPEGARLDQHLVAHGLEPLPVPDRARVVVFWEQSGSALPQPAAIVVDATEALSRSRRYPRRITDATTPDAASRWVVEQREWLTVRTGGDAGAVSSVVWGPGRQRAVLVLAPASRGKRVTLDLVELEMPDLPFLGVAETSRPMVDLTLARAPWEED